MDMKEILEKWFGYRAPRALTSEQIATMKSRREEAQFPNQVYVAVCYHQEQLRKKFEKARNIDLQQLRGVDAVDAVAAHCNVNESTVKRNYAKYRWFAEEAFDLLPLEDGCPVSEFPAKEEVIKTFNAYQNVDRNRLRITQYLNDRVLTRRNRKI